MPSTKQVQQATKWCEGGLTAPVDVPRGVWQAQCPKCGRGVWLTNNRLIPRHYPTVPVNHRSTPPAKPSMRKSTKAAYDQGYSEGYDAGYAAGMNGDD